MIKANELRIGNFVYGNSKGLLLPGTILSIQKRKTNIQTKIGSYNIEYNCITPIPLTEEWLIKFGFERIDYSSEKTGYGIEYHLRVNEDVFFNYSDDFSLSIYANKKAMENDIGVLPKWETIKHIHQLQNLYFALTSAELKF